MRGRSHGAITLPNIVSTLSTLGALIPRIRCFYKKKKSVRCEFSSQVSSGCDGTATFRGANDYRSNRSDQLCDLPYTICGDLTSCLVMLACRGCALHVGAFLMCTVVQRTPSFLVIISLTQSPPNKVACCHARPPYFATLAPEFPLDFISATLKGVTAELFVPSSPTRIVSFFPDVCSSGPRLDTAMARWTVGWFRASLTTPRSPMVWLACG